MSRRFISAPPLKYPVERTQQAIIICGIGEKSKTGACRAQGHYISDKLEPFPNLPQSMLITFSMNENTESKVKTAILSKQDFSLLNDFTYIDFVKSDDPDNYRHTAIKVNDEIRNTWGAINYGVMDISDVENSDVELSCILLNFIDENINDEREKLAQI